MNASTDRITRVTVMLLGALLLQATESALAASDDWCPGRVETSLANLSSSFGALDSAQKAQLRAEVLAVCHEAQTASSAAMNAQAGSTDADSSPPESSTILGVEIRRAPDGADGYARVRK